MTLTTEKRSSLLKLGAITILVMVAFWSLLVRPTQARINQKEKADADLTQKIAFKKQVIQRADQLTGQLQESGRKLQEIEDEMVKGDMYRWIIKTMRDFEIPQQIEFSKYEPPQIVESHVSYKLPYQTVSYAITGVATYHDLGKFIERFENIYPYIRFHRVEMEPANLEFSSGEKLSFLIELHVLVKPETSASKPKSIQ